ncbi:MAG: hypothetical protein IKX54_04110 [Lachnospiraceae bacterium]|nr:hypothetical protein [Lachnospiraceae bacterium]
MIYIACAIYMEASPFLRLFDCKKQDSFLHGQVYAGEDAVVVITGTSPIPAAAALTELLTKLPPCETDIFANVGLCGCNDESVAPGSLYLAHSITDAASGRQFFPDLLYLHEHPTASLTTYSTVVESLPEAETPDGVSRDPFLFDMEASGLYLAALPHFSTDRMYFFKIVSDHGSDAREISPTEAFERIGDRAGGIAETLQRFASYTPRRYVYSDGEAALIDYFCRSLHCSVTMEHELRRLILYYELERGYAIAHLRDFFAEHGLSFEDNILLGSRKEGKDVLDAFRISCLC